MSEAETHKEKGNSFFREKKYTQALECYLLAAQIDPKNAVYNSNL
jgi:tetratricopeptide (TPR) repeat protein